MKLTVIQIIFSIPRYHITFLPTRVTDYSATVIDNIFSNATDFETVSGNILNQIADRFSQFLILRKLSVTHKDIAFYQYDYSNFDKDKFTADFSKINWLEESHSSNVREKFFNFHNKVSNCVKQHVPLVKLSRKKSFFTFKTLDKSKN